MENLQSILVIAAIFVLGVITFKIRYNSARKRSRHHVIARVKKQEKGIWLCKFFWCGNHLGYLRRRPSRDRVPAIVVGYDEKRQCYELEELERD